MAVVWKMEIERFETKSLYETCLNVISSEFGVIDKKYFKDLPKHILEEILPTLNPFCLETVENEEFLNLRDISTDLLWKTHYMHDFKYYEGKIRVSRSTVKNPNSQKSWRVCYFEKHFHTLIHRTASVWAVPLPPLGKSFEGTNGSPLHFDDVIDVYIKHLSEIRLQNNATCIFLARNRDILMKLAPVLGHVEMNHLRDEGVDALVNILEVLIEHKLNSFRLSNCKVEDLERLRALFKILATSQTLDSQALMIQYQLASEQEKGVGTRLPIRLKDGKSCTTLPGKCCATEPPPAQENPEKESACLKSEIINENIKQHENLKSFDDKRSYCPSSSERHNDSFATGKNMRNYNMYSDRQRANVNTSNSMYNKKDHSYCNDLRAFGDNKFTCPSASSKSHDNSCSGITDIGAERNISTDMFKMDSDKVLTRLSNDGQASDEDCLGNEDDLYEDIFSKCSTSQDVRLEASQAASTTIDSPSVMQKLWQRKSKPNRANTQVDLYEGVVSTSATFQDTCQDNQAASTTIESPSTMQKLWQSESKPGLTYDPIRQNCLMELKLYTSLMTNASVKVFSEELIFFLNLRSLTLSYVGSSIYPAANDVVTSIKTLVNQGSLRHLVFENGVKDEDEMEVFCQMLISSCERCQSKQPRKGLLSLHLGNWGPMNIDLLGEVLRTCSFCEERASSLRTADGIWFKTRDGALHSACKCLNSDVLKSLDYRLNLPEACNQNEDGNAQQFFSQTGSAERTESCVSSRHQYITTGIEDLYLRFSDMNGRKAQLAVLASSLLRNRSLRSISFPLCCLDTEDISNLFDCISGSDFHECNTRIEKLDLRQNEFQDVVGQNRSLCNLLMRSHLVYLDLSNCGLEVIPDNVVLALSSNKALQVFKIAGNRLGDAGLNQLSKVFTGSKKTSVLNTLDLSCNRLTSSSLLDFASVLMTWPTKLRELAIRKNPRVDSAIVTVSLHQVFNVVLLESVDVSTSYADYLSEM